uniref:Mpv17-like protein 2 n=1 Tax=Arion vulgaris TaxID=1028688 RepID=A0A0B6YBP3_9EUPU
MSSVAKIKNCLDKLFTKHLLATNVVACGTLLGVGDCVVQRINMFSNKEQRYDFSRTGRMIIIGFGLGPFNHYWYALLDRMIKGSTGLSVIKKIACDQLVAAPFFCTSFLSGLALLEGEGIDGAKTEMKDKFLKIYMFDWTFWPLAQFVNFRFVPGNLRVVYVSSATLLWNSFLSFVKHEHKPQESSVG